jgi:hypothetical protein
MMKPGADRNHPPSDAHPDRQRPEPGDLFLGELPVLDDRRAQPEFVDQLD